MVKNKPLKIRYVCSECGNQSSKWLGRCPACGQWDSMIEDVAAASGERPLLTGGVPRPLSLAPDQDYSRTATGIEELDRVLGGGIVPGSVVLIGGDPGIGKSTLLLHLLYALADLGQSVLYVSGEESAHQIKMRAKRLSAIHDNLFLATECNVERIVTMSRAMRPSLLAIDSVQTLSCAEYPSAPGSITQVRESAARLVELAKQDGVPVVLVGHVTKDGSIAGPKTLEHMVDTVLYFEGENRHAFRLLRTVKNRYGSTNEIGVFEMKEEGLVPVSNPSELFLAERPIDVSGSVVMPSLEGTRPILVEVQALVSPTNLGMARRTAIGADPQRLSLLCAILEKKVDMNLYGHDIFLNIAGGIRIDEPALDLGVICALVSSMREKPVAADLLVCGEVGLAGEVRAVGGMEQRMREAERLGFRKIFMPYANLERVGRTSSLAVAGVSSINEFLEEIFDR